MLRVLLALELLSSGHSVTHSAFLFPVVSFSIAFVGKKVKVKKVG